MVYQASTWDGAAMAEEETSLFFLEFPDEVDACLREQPSGEDLLGSSTVIALNPATLAYLRRRGYDAEDTLLYLTPASRERAWERSSALNRWMREHFDFEDNWGVRAGYVENLVWYTRWVIHYLLWSLEILDNAVTKHEGEFHKGLRAGGRWNVSGHLTGSTERYFSAMAQRFRVGQGVPTPLVPHTYPLIAIDPCRKRCTQLHQRVSDQLFDGANAPAPSSPI